MFALHSRNRFALNSDTSAHRRTPLLSNVSAARGADGHASRSLGFVGWFLVIQRASGFQRHSPARTAPPSLVIGRHSRRGLACPRARRSASLIERWSCFPTSWVIERPSRAGASTGELWRFATDLYDAPLARQLWNARANALARVVAAKRGSLCRCSFGRCGTQSAGQHSSPSSAFSDSSASAATTPGKTPTPSVCRLLPTASRQSLTVCKSQPARRRRRQNNAAPAPRRISPGWQASRFSLARR